MLDFAATKNERAIMSFRNLEVWQMARAAVVEIHNMTLTKLPKFEMYEEGSQIRRSVKSIRSNIVEGYGRRRYKQEFVKHLVYALGSCDETMDHLEILFATDSLKDKPLYDALHERMEVLGRKVNRFLKSIETGQQSEK
jgi:four helix bundle protein